MTYPLILAHGICRFDAPLNTVFRLDNRADDSLHYFRRIRGTLRRAGFVVYHSNVEWGAGVEVRARTLRKNIENILRETGAPKVNIIAHSMGGLDARRMLYDGRDDGFHEKVAALATVGTPHLGTPFADWGVARFGGVLDALNKIGLDVTGFKDLTVASCTEFNRAAAEFEQNRGVLFHTYAGTKEFAEVFPPLKPSHRFIEKREGPNDGLVSLRSQKWKDEYFKKHLEADHLNQVGRLGGKGLCGGEEVAAFQRMIRDFYLEVAAALP